MNRKVTRKDVAKLAGVSETTVSIVMNNRRDIAIASATRERVLETAKKLGYHPNYAARTMVIGKSHTIGVLSQWDVQTWFFAQMLNGIRHSASGAGYGVLLCNMLEDQKKPEDCIKYFLESRIDGVIYLPPTTIEMPGLDYLLENNIPTVIANGVDPYNHFDYIVIDYAAGIYQAVEYLIANGFGKLYYFQPGNEVESLSAGDRERVKGFDAAVKGHSNVEGFRVGFDFSKSPEERYEFCREFVSSCSFPTGIVTCWWQPAYYIQAAATKAGIKLGKDIRVISGDRPASVADIFPPIYGIDLPFFEIGRSCMNIMLERLKNRDMPLRREMIKAELITC